MWGTPLVIKVSDYQGLVTTFPYRLVAYEPSSGKGLWFSQGVAESSCVSPLSPWRANGYTPSPRHPA